MDFTEEQIKNRKHDNVCFDCGRQFLTEKQLNGEGGVCTAWYGECCLCKEHKSVTNIRHFNYLRIPKK